MNLRVAQVGDIAGVAPALAAALREAGHDTIEIGMDRLGADWPRWLKPLAAPFRYIHSEGLALSIADLAPDIAHVHWLPNALIGRDLSARGRRDWLIHVHGSDVRAPGRWRRRLLAAAPAVVYSTPDLAWVRPDATYLPVPIPTLHITAEPRWDLLLASRASPAKGSRVAFAAARLVGTNLAALDGPAFEAGPWERLPFAMKAEHHRRLASARVVMGQFAATALGISELEAMMLGRPVVGGVDLSLYPDPPPVLVAHTAENAAAAVVELLTDSRRSEELGQRGREWVLRHHRPERIAERLLAVYEEVRS